MAVAISRGARIKDGMGKALQRTRRRRVRSPSLRPRRRLHRILLVLGLIVVGVVMAGLLIIYVPAAYRSWREARLLKQASEMLRKENFAEASRTAHEALRIKGDSLLAFTILAEATERENQQETIAWRAQIARMLPHDLASQLNLVSAALRFGQLDIARKALERVPPNDRDKASYHIVAGWLARAQGNEEDVEKHFAAAVAKEPNNEIYQFNLAVIQIHSEDEKKSATARSTLQRLTKVGEFRAGALRALLSDAVQNNDLKAADGFAQELQLSPQVTFGDYLLFLDFYQKLDSKKFGAVLEKVKPVAARNSGDLAKLMGWMNHHDLSAEVLKWEDKLKPEQTTHPPPAIAIAEAFVAVKNWSRLKRWTRNGAWGDAEFLRLGYQAYAVRRSHPSGADAEFDSLWSSAEYATANNPERQAELARLATTGGLTSQAEQLWLQVSKNAPMRREAFDALIEIYRQKKDLPNLHLVMRRLHESSPNEWGATADLARVGLLIDPHAAESHRLAQEAYDKAPNDANCAVTYAFSLYCRGRAAEGVEILKKVKPEQLHDPHAAVYTAVLLLDQNQVDAAKEFVDVAEKGAIFPEEKQLLDLARAKAAATPSPLPTVSPPPAASPMPSISPIPQS